MCSTLTINECVVDSLHLMVFQTLSIPLWDYSRLILVPFVYLAIILIQDFQVQLRAVKAWLYKGFVLMLLSVLERVYHVL